MKFNKYEFKKDFIFKNNQIHLTSSGFSKVTKKKITGSRIGSILGNNPYRTPFQAWCEMLGFFVEEPDQYFLKAGRIIEKKLLSYVKLKKNLNFFSPLGFSDIFPENEIFGGIPDAELADSNGKVISILEIKTATLDKYKWIFKNNQFRLKLENNKPIVDKKHGGLQKWFKLGQIVIPESYEDQLSLYLHLRGADKGYFCIAFLSQQDYEDPESVQFKTEFHESSPQSTFPGHLLIWKEFHLNKHQFSKKLEKAFIWYQNHIVLGVSPPLTSQDLTWFRYGYPDLK